jgi:hypothetical protein
MQFDDIGVLEFLETLNLTQAVAILPSPVLGLHLLDGHYVVVGRNGLEDDPEGTVADGFNYLILLHVFIIVIISCKQFDDWVGWRFIAYISVTIGAAL